MVSGDRSVAVIPGKAWLKVCFGLFNTMIEGGPAAAGRLLSSFVGAYLAGFRRRAFLPFAGLDFVFAHTDRPGGTVEFKIKATGIAHGRPVFISSPQGSLGGVAIGTRRIGAQSCSPTGQVNQ